MWSEYTLHTTAGETDVEARNIEELRSELERRLASGEFENEAAKKRWMPVSTHGKHLVGRVDLRGRPMSALAGLGERGLDSGTPPYVIHTTGGNVETAAWSVHEFRIELGRNLDGDRLPKFDAAPNLGRSRTVTQGRRRVGFIDWETGEFTPTDNSEEVAFWVRHGAGSFPIAADDLAALHQELTPLTQSGAFLQSGKTEYWLDVIGPHGVVERRVAAFGREYREEAVPVPYTVHRAQSTVAGKSYFQRPLRCTAKEVGELRTELGQLLHEGEFQIEEDCRVRWLPVTQADCLVGYVDTAERLFVPKTNRRIRYRIGTDRSDGVPLAADGIDDLRSELEARGDDLRHLVEWGDAHVYCEGRSIGRVVDDGTLLLSGNEQGGPDGSSCGSCRYWRFRDEMQVRDHTGRIEAIVSEGQCRRWSPHPRHGWPVTRCSAWCGEHLSRPEAG